MRWTLLAISLASMALAGCGDDPKGAGAPATSPPPAPDVDAGSPLIPPTDPDAGATAPPPPPTPVGPTTTKSFQQGVDGYAGTKSVGISTYGGLGGVSDYNANGSTFADGDNDWCTGIDIPQGAYSEVWLLRFEDLGLPANAQIVEAKLSVHAYGNDSANNLFLAGSYLAQSWHGDTPIACAGCSSSPVGWRYRNGAAEPWGALGAAASGTDYLAGKSFRIPDAGSVALGSTPNEYTATLDPTVVQGWITGSNFGVRIVAGQTNVHMGYVQAQRNGGRPVTMRPKLTITYAVP